MLSLKHLSCVMRKPTVWFLTRPDTKRAVQAQEIARGWKVLMLKEEVMCYPCSKNASQLLRR